MVGEWQPLDVIVQCISEIPGHVLAGHGLETAFSVREQPVQQVQRHYGKAHQIQVPDHIVRVAVNAHQPVQDRRQHAGLAGQVMIQRFRQHQRYQIIQNDAGCRADQRPDKPQGVPADQPPSQ